VWWLQLGQNIVCKVQQQQQDVSNKIDSIFLTHCKTPLWMQEAEGAAVAGGVRRRGD
jgi:hypothetical protein